MNKELKEQTHKEFHEQFGYLNGNNESYDSELVFIDSIIDKTVQQTEEILHKKCGKKIEVYQMAVNQLVI